MKPAVYVTLLVALLLSTLMLTVALIVMETLFAGKQAGPAKPAKGPSGLPQTPNETSNELECFCFLPRTGAIQVFRNHKMVELLDGVTNIAFYSPSGVVNYLPGASAPKATEPKKEEAELSLEASWALISKARKRERIAFNATMIALLFFVGLKAYSRFRVRK